MRFTKLFDQHRSRPMEPGSNGPYRATQRRGRFLVTHFLELAKNHHLAIVLRQCPNRLADAADGFDGSKFVPARCGCKSAVTVSVSVGAVSAGSTPGLGPGRCCIAQVVRVAVERHEPPVSLPPFPQVISSDTEQKAAQGSAG